jgi:hypothetical protein
MAAERGVVSYVVLAVFAEHGRPPFELACDSIDDGHKGFACRQQA